MKSPAQTVPFRDASMTVLKRLLTAAVLSAVASGSQAAIVNLGELPLAPSVFSQTMSKSGAGGFADRFNFSFPVLGDLASASAITIDAMQVLNIDSLRISLFDAGNNLLAVGLVGESSHVTNVSLTGGASYYFSVTGQVTGSLGGVYQFLAAASPRLSGNAVPEPGSAALVLAALAGLALVSKARRA